MWSSEPFSPISAPVSGYSTEAQQFFTRLDSNPGTAREDVYAALIDGLVSDGVWSHLDVLYIFAANTRNNALINLKQATYSPATSHGTENFSPNNGFIGNGSDFYIGTGFVPPTAAGAGSQYQQDAASVGVYSITDSTTIAGDYYCGSSAGDFSCMLSITPRLDASGSQNAMRINESSATSEGFSNANRKGQYLIVRRAGSGAGATEFYRNGSSLGTSSNVSSSIANLPELAFFAHNHGGSVFDYTPDAFSAAVIGGSLTGPQSIALCARINNYMTALSISNYTNP